jgi:poly-D-alanine transfer protein DltD
MDNFNLKKYLTENKLNEVDKGAMYQLIKLRDIENPYNLHKDLISSLNRFARATVAKEQGYQGVGLDNELQLTRLDVNNQAAFHKLDREEVKDTLKKALELYRSNLNEGKADRDILKKKYGSALEEQDTITKMTDFGPIDVPNTEKYIKKSPEEMTMKELIARIEELEKGKFSNENARELKDLRAELSYRQNFKNESFSIRKK